MPTTEKEELVQTVAADLDSAAAFYLVSFSGLSVGDMTDLRGQVLAAGGRLQVVKNRLLKLALGEERAEELAESLTGPTMVAFCTEDPVAPAQAMTKFAESHEGLVLKAGYVEGKPVSGVQAEAIAKLPPREQILAETLGAIASPASGLVGVFNAILGELTGVMEAYVEKQQGAA